jgi:hypothetical protein
MCFEHTKRNFFVSFFVGLLPVGFCVGNRHATRVAPQNHHVYSYKFIIFIIFNLFPLQIKCIERSGRFSDAFFFFLRDTFWKNTLNRRCKSFIQHQNNIYQYFFITMKTFFEKKLKGDGFLLVFFLCVQVFFFFFPFSISRS